MHSRRPRNQYRPQDSREEVASDKNFFFATVPKFAARNIVDNSVKNARPVSVPGTKDELRVRISR
jgi:hypothetical protein